MTNETMLPLSEEQMQKCWSDIDAAERVRKTYETWWDANIDAYSPKVDQRPQSLRRRHQHQPRLHARVDRRSRSCSSSRPRSTSSLPR